MGIWTNLMVAAALCASVTTAHAYDRYSVNRDATNCRACHGDFRASSYFSAADNADWNVNLHDLHRTTMVSSDCDTCHSAGPRFPVLTSSSVGGDGLTAIACIGCHGRAEDDNMMNPDFGTYGGFGAGLRQHHWDAGVMICNTCHMDADPANYTTVGEHVLPPYYATPGNNHPNMPASSCNEIGGEDFAGLAAGLDNDGDAGVPMLDAAAPATDAAAPATDAGAPGTDAGAPGTDAGSSTADAAAAPDAGSAMGSDAGQGDDDTSGCGCRFNGGADPLGTALLLLGLVAALRRRAR